jgi:hypothetical protein
VDSKESKSVKAGYRSVGFLLVAGFACIGFMRLEDRAIIGPPGSPANAMSAFVAADPDEEADAGSYDEPPEEVLALDRARRAPGNRIRRIVTETNVPAVAARQILGGPPSTNAQAPGNPLQPETTPAVVSTLSGIDSVTPTFASLAPPLPGTGTPVFAAEGTPPGGGGGGGNPTDPTDPTDPVTPVPEPSTWLMLMLGLFGVGAAMRRRPVVGRRFAISAA